MGSKSRTTNDDILDQILTDNDLAQRVEDLQGIGSDDAAEGICITSQEQFDKLYQSVDDIEKYLRS